MKTPSSTAIGLWLRSAREKLGLSRHVLATEAGISTSTLRNAEKGRHRIVRRTAALLLQEIARRDVILAHTAPPALKEAASPASKRTRQALPERRPLVRLRFQPAGAHSLLQLELDPLAVRQFARALRDLLARSERAPKGDLPGLHLVLIEQD
jgi:transcriptional regulator with XRE-family HTH domain